MSGPTETERRIGTRAARCSRGSAPSNIDARAERKAEPWRHQPVAVASTGRRGRRIAEGERRAFARPLESVASGGRAGSDREPAGRSPRRVHGSADEPGDSHLARKLPNFGRNPARSSQIPGNARAAGFRHAGAGPDHRGKRTSGSPLEGFDRDDAAGAVRDCRGQSDRIGDLPSIAEGAHRHYALVVEFHTRLLLHPSSDFSDAAGPGGRRDPPSLNHPIPGAGHHASPIRVKGHAKDGVRVVQGGAELRPRFGVEEPRRPIVAGRQQRLPVRAEGQDDDLPSILPQFVEQRTSGRVPHAARSRRDIP